MTTTLGPLTTRRQRTPVGIGRTGDGFICNLLPSTGTATDFNVEDALSAEIVGLVVDEMRQRQRRPAEKPLVTLTPRERELVQLISEGYSSTEVAERLRQARLERAIGVIYRPETERFSHYFLARMADQFDAVLHFDRTEALVPLDRDSGWETPEELPETFPFAV